MLFCAIKKKCAPAFIKVVVITKFMRQNKELLRVREGKQANQPSLGAKTGRIVRKEL